MKKGKSIWQKEIETMTVVVILVVALFTGIIGFILGQTSTLGMVIK